MQFLESNYYNATTSKENMLMHIVYHYCYKHNGFTKLQLMFCHKVCSYLAYFCYKELMEISTKLTFTIWNQAQYVKIKIAIYWQINSLRSIFHILDLIYRPGRYVIVNVMQPMKTNQNQLYMYPVHHSNIRISQHSVVAMYSYCIMHSAQDDLFNACLHA